MAQPTALAQGMEAEGARTSAADSSPSLTAEVMAAQQPAAAPRRRLPTTRLIGIALGAVLGVGAAASFGFRSASTPATVATSSPTIKTATAAAAPPPVAPAAAAEPVGPAPVAPSAREGNPVAQEAAQATPALLLSSAPSCQELLGDAYVEKRDAAAAFEQTQAGQRELIRGNVAGMQAAFCKAALWDGSNAERWFNLAQLFLIRRDAAKAAESAQRVLELQPGHTRGRGVLGDAWAMLGKTKEAREAYLLAEGHAELDAPALQLIIRRDMAEAQRMVKRRDFMRAERLFRRVMVFDAGHAEASAGLTVSLARLGDSHPPN